MVKIKLFLQLNLPYKEFKMSNAEYSYGNMMIESWSLILMAQLPDQMSWDRLCQ